MTEILPSYRGQPPAGRRFRAVPVRVLIPNVVTLLSLCAGLTAIRFALEGGAEKLELAVIAILVAAVLDGLDGRLARLLNGASRFGAELDSLADFLSFGVAPAVILYAYGLSELGSFGWFIALAFAMACALRLARFNVMLDDPDRPKWQRNFFVGIPAPAGALTALLPISLQLLGLQLSGGLVVVEAAYIAFIAFMMVSRIPTFSGKKLGPVPRSLVIPLLIIAVLFVALLASFPFGVLVAMTVVYLAAIPFSLLSYRRLERIDVMKRSADPDKQDAETIFPR